MPYRCVHCNKMYGDASQAVLSGCDSCGKKFFFYIRKDQAEKIKVVAEEIEAKLSKLTSSFAISYREDAKFGQRVVLVLESNKSISISEFDFLDLPKHERPKEVVCINELPRTANGKIQRKKLQELIMKQD